MKNLLLIATLFLFINASKAQSFGFRYDDNLAKVEIPFEIRNDFIVVKIIFNKRIPLHFIFDTGAEHTILTKKIYSEMLGLKLDRAINFIGADLKTVLTAYVARNVHIKLGDIVAPTQDILIFDEDYIKMDELVGKEIQGILGVDLFKSFTLEIDYKKQILIFHNPKKFKVPKGKWKVFPISIEKGKPYLDVNGFFNQKKIGLKLLIDTGASLPILLHTNTHPNLELPEKYIPGSLGNGLGGTLDGFIARLERIEFGNLYFENLIANFQDLPLSSDSLKITKRNGIFGNALLMRFRIIIDYQNTKMYFLPNRKYNRSMGFDKSGLHLIASGKNLKTFLVHFVIPNSPADNAGLKKGDAIIKINHLSSKLLSLREVTKKLQKRNNKKIRLTIIRNDKKLKYKFRLKDLL